MRANRTDLGFAALCAERATLGEGPVWDHRHGRLLWVDIEQGRVHCWSHAEGHSLLAERDALIGMVALAGRDDLLLATSEGLLRRDGATGDVTMLGDPLRGAPVRFNDGKIDPAGRLWVGTMALDPARHAEPLGSLWRYDPTHGFECVLEGLTISNGLGWSRDGHTFYLTDTMRREIRVYNFDSVASEIIDLRATWRTDPAHGYPDGLAVDADGFVWSAGFGAGVLCRYHPAGERVQVLELPVSCPTALAFGGPNLATVFCTSSTHLLAPGHGESLGGAVLRFDTTARGVRANIFEAA